jgi:hypothetical protein
MENIVLAAYFVLLTLTGLMALARWNKLSRSDKRICFLLVLTILNEAVARYLSVTYHNDMVAFHIYSPLELLVFCCYFNDFVPVLRRHNKGLWLGITGLAFALINMAYFQPADTLNSNFLLFESVSVVALCLASYCHILSDIGLPYRSSAQFWITTAMMGYWSFSLVQWGMYMLLQGDASAYHPVIYFLWFVNFSFYLVLLSVFSFYNKLIPSGHGK